MEMFISLLVQIISGAVGGNLAGMTKQSLGTRSEEHTSELQSQ